MDLQENTLPVCGVLPELAAVLKQSGRAVLAAPPGAGKTTLVPPYLLKTLYDSGGRIVLLEPRRVAARAAAARIAALLGDHVGGVAGYRVRGESRVSGATRIEVVTEGVLTRMVQDDPELSGVSLVIFDESSGGGSGAGAGLGCARRPAGGSGGAGDVRHAGGGADCRPAG